MHVWRVEDLPLAFCVCRTSSSVSLRKRLRGSRSLPLPAHIQQATRDSAHQRAMAVSRDVLTLHTCGQGGHELRPTSLGK
jgi:hypothetical protein